MKRIAISVVLLGFTFFAAYSNELSIIDCNTGFIFTFDTEVSDIFAVYGEPINVVEYNNEDERFIKISVHYDGFKFSYLRGIKKVEYFDAFSENFHTFRNLKIGDNASEIYEKYENAFQVQQFYDLIVEQLEDPQNIGYYGEKALTAEIENGIIVSFVLVKYAD